MASCTSTIDSAATRRLHRERLKRFDMRASGTDVAHLLMSGILDKTGRIPLGGDDVCFERAGCDD